MGRPMQASAAVPAAKRNGAKGKTGGRVQRKRISMQEESEVQTRIVKRVPSFWIYALLMVLAVYTAVTWVKQDTQIQILARAMSEVQAKIDRETKSNAKLQEQKLEIASDDSIEQIAREKLGYVKDGERIFVDANK